MSEPGLHDHRDEFIIDMSCGRSCNLSGRKDWERPVWDRSPVSLCMSMGLHCGILLYVDVMK